MKQQTVATVAEITDFLGEALDVIEQSRSYWSRAFSTGPKSYKVVLNRKQRFDMYNIRGQ